MRSLLFVVHEYTKIVVSSRKMLLLAIISSYLLYILINFNIEVVTLTTFNTLQLCEQSKLPNLNVLHHFVTIITNGKIGVQNSPNQSAGTLVTEEMLK